MNYSEAVQLRVDPELGTYFLFFKGVEPFIKPLDKDTLSKLCEESCEGTARCLSGQSQLQELNDPSGALECRAMQAPSQTCVADSLILFYLEVSCPTGVLQYYCIDAATFYLSRSQTSFSQTASPALLGWHLL